jgi:2-polyprenyl-3-methyl-5-hydroxy-6-metoxy-1,4-benzoquinol methylase
MRENVDVDRLDRFTFASRKLPEYMHFRLMRCAICDLIFTCNSLDTGWVQNGYRDAAFDAGVESEYAARSYAKEMERIVPVLSSRSSALDIGAGDGAFLVELSRFGFSQIIGVEPSLEPVRRARPEVAAMIRNEFFRPDDYQPGAQDLVTCFQTLEHVEDPLSLCRSVHGLLSEGGAFVTVAHDFRALPARILGARSPIYDVEHLQLFSEDSLRKLFLSAGFKDVSIRPMRNVYPLHYWLRLAPLPKGVKEVVYDRARRSKFGQWMIGAKVGNLLAVGYR